MPGQPTPPKKSRRLLIILASVGGAAVLGIGGIVVSNLQTDAAIERQTPDVGECIDEASLTAPETNVVDCGSAEAAWEVIGEHGSMTGADFQLTSEEEICTAFPETEYILWVGEDSTDGSGDGQVVCMVSVGSE
jgi:hypothetical protein